jgi:DNA-directed RNA polymerase subunit RPC12/RpoP
MVDVVCPVCGEESSVHRDELTLYARIQCEACGSLLEVVEESPLELEQAEEVMPLDDEGDDYDEDDDED